MLSIFFIFCGCTFNSQYTLPLNVLQLLNQLGRPVMQPSRNTLGWNEWPSPLECVCTLLQSTLSDFQIFCEKICRKTTLFLVSYLVQHINHGLCGHDATDICFMNGSKLLTCGWSFHHAQRLGPRLTHCCSLFLTCFPLEFILSMSQVKGSLYTMRPLRCAGSPWLALMVELSGLFSGTLTHHWGSM